MDTTTSPNRKRKKLEHGSEKLTPDNRIGASRKHELADDEFELDGKIVKMAPDLKDLQEIDYDDPEVRKWLNEQEADYMYARRVMLQQTLPEKSAEELNKMALAEFRSGNKHPIPKGLKQKLLCANGEYVEILVESIIALDKMY